MGIKKYLTQLAMMVFLILSIKLVWDFVLKKQQVIFKLQEKIKINIVKHHIRDTLKLTNREFSKDRLFQLRLSRKINKNNLLKINRQKDLNNKKLVRFLQHSARQERSRLLILLKLTTEPAL
jgi:hypothetical protein